nr:polymorphic toxin-type HINT domain-containing protein [Streptomyces sp. SID3343]
MGRPTAGVFSSKDQEQWRTTTTYTGSDQVASTPVPGGTATLSISDARGKARELREYAGGTPAGTDYTKITYTYSPREELQSVTDAGGNTWTYTYDFLGRKTHTEDPDKGPSDTRYDLVGRVTGTTDARGQNLAYTYDALGRKTASYKDAIADANLLSSWSYDRYARGLADGSTHYVGGKSGAKYTSEITGFEPGTYRPTGSRVTIPAAEGKLAGTYETSTTYEPVLGLPKTNVLPSHGGLTAETLRYSYNDAGAVTTMGGRITYLAWADYDAFGRNIRATVGGTNRQATSTNTYDDATGRLLGTDWDKQTATRTSVDATTYTYKPSGDVTSITTKRDNNTTDTQCFAYDGMRRLKEAWTDTAGTTTRPEPSVPGIGACITQTPTPSTVGGPDAYWQSFEYDAVGNRTKLVDHDPTNDPTKNVTTDYGYRTRPGTARTHVLDTITTRTGTREAITTGLTYDPAGNTKTRPGADANLQTLTWNEEDKLAKVASATATSDYLYDADGNRIIRREAGKTTLYLGTDELTTNTDQSGPVIATRTYPTPGGITTVRVATGTPVYVASDHHGTGTTTLDGTTLTATRRQSKPFGEARGPQPTQANGQWPTGKGFLDKPMDATGLTHMGAREYDPNLGRFISVDPIMDLTDTQQMHGYTYSNNTPVTASDPTGLLWGIDWFKSVTTKVGNAISAAVRAAPSPAEAPPVTTGGNPTGGGGGGQKSPGGGCRNNYVEICKGPKTVTMIIPPEMKKGTKVPERNDYVQIAAGFGAGAYRALDPCALTGGWFTGKRCGSDMVDDWAAREGLNESPYGCDGVMACEDDYGDGKKLFDITSMTMAMGTSGNRAVTIVCRNSFLPTTSVLMADGSTKTLQEIKPGDVVLATDSETGESRPRVVLATITTEDDKEFADLTVATEHGDFSIIATANHPFWLPALKQWVNAGDLKPSQWLQTSSGTWVQVRAVRLFDQTARTYNLTVDADHTYYVLAGRTPVLVHNNNFCHPEGLAAAAAARDDANYANSTTMSGALWIDEFDDSIALNSGRSNLSPDHVRPPGALNGFESHLEVQAAAEMRRLNAQRADLYISGDYICGPCSQTLSQMLPRGSELNVTLRTKSGSIKTVTFTGGAD